MRSDGPLVSIVLPTHNDSEHLARAVGTVLQQTYPRWELVIVDDASTDATPQTIASFDDTRIRPVRCDRNRGVAFATNTGIDHAAGDIIVILHSDDALLPEMLERHVALVEASGQSIDGVQSAVEVSWADHTEVWSPTLQDLGPMDLLWPHTRIHLSGISVRRELAKEIEFDSRLRGVEDRDFCLRLVRRAQLVFTPETLSRVVKRAGSLSSQPMAPAYVLLLEKYRDEIESNPRLHAEWEFLIARAHARAGDHRDARRALRQSIRLHPWKGSRVLLALVCSAGDAATRAAFTAYVRGSRSRRGIRS